jgi:hypothetical protein
VIGGKPYNLKNVGKAVSTLWNSHSSFDLN